MKFCPRCGTSLIAGDAFCEQCGFKIDLDVPVSSGFPSNEPPQGIPDIPPPSLADLQHQQIANNAYQSSPPDINASVSKKKGKPVLILLIVGAIIVLGVGGWLVYDNFVKEKPVVAVTDTSNVMNPESVATISDSNAKTNEPQATQVPVSAADNATKTKAPSQTGKVTAPALPSNANVETKSVAKTTTPVSKHVNTNTPVKEKQPENATPAEANTQHATAENDEPSTLTIFQVGQLGLSILKNPMKDCAFTLKGRYYISRITTDHYNNGNGTSRTGIIGIEDMKGKIVKQLRAKGKSSSSGVANCKWFIEPGIILDAGTYKIIDSDKETWTKKITGVGFVLIEGYKVN